MSENDFVVCVSNFRATNVIFNLLCFPKPPFYIPFNEGKSPGKIIKISDSDIFYFQALKEKFFYRKITALRLCFRGYL